MRLAAKWQSTLSMVSPEIRRGRLESVRIDDDWVEVLRLGRGKPIVLVPGLAGSWKLLLPLAESLARYYEVFACGLHGDRFAWNGTGGGRSRACDLAEHAHDLACLIEQLGLECPAIFGVSFGAAIALEFAVEYPYRLGALVVQGAESRFRASLGSRIARLVLERFPLPCDSPFVNQFSHLLYGGRPEPGPLVDFVVERIWETDQSVIAQRLAQLESFDIRDRLSRIDVPTLVLAGSRDVIVSPARQRALAAAIPGARFEVIQDAGHIAFLTHRAIMVRQVRRHLRRVRAAVQH